MLMHCPKSGSRMIKIVLVDQKTARIMFIVDKDRELAKKQERITLPQPLHP